MAQMYERYLRVLKKWPMLPENRLSRCLGYHIRQRGKEVFSKKGELTVNIQECEEQMKCLERIADDHWLKKYPRTRNSSALGFPRENCGILMTRECLEVLEKEHSTFFRSVWFRTKIWFKARML